MMTHSIVIANTLKPIDDVRAYEKIAQSMAKTNKYEINIIGNQGKKEFAGSNITFLPHKLNHASVIKRIILREKILFKLLKLRPEILIITTHELLNTALILKLIRGTKIIYDVQEDYLKNLKYLSSLPLGLNVIVGILIRLKEKLLSPVVDQFWLAEKCYSYEIKFPASKSVVIENKALEPVDENVNVDQYKFLFSGTISNYSQVLLAHDFFKQIKSQIKDASLTIIGQCHDSKLHNKLQALNSTDDSIQLKISYYPIAHQEIIQEIKTAKLGIISYQPNQVNQNKIPTKLFEYSRHRLPYVIQRGSTWERVSGRLGGSIAIDFENPDIEKVIETMLDSSDLFPTKYPQAETWESQETVLNNSLSSLIEPS